MTVICLGGTSSPQPWASPVLFLSGETLAAILTDGIGTSIWYDLVAYAGSQTFTLSGFCAADPPAVPVFSAADILDIINPDPFLPGTGMQKLNDLLAIGVWHVFCRCDSGAPPTVVVPPAYPAAAPVLNPTNAPGATVPPCWDKITLAFESNGHDQNLGSQLLPWTSTVAVVGDGTAPSLVAATIPTGITNVTYDVHVNNSASATDSLYLTLEQYQGNGNQADFTQMALILNRNAHATGNIAINNLARSWSVMFGVNAGAATLSATVEIKFFCPGQTPNMPVTPCCPPDPTLLAELSRIEAMLQSIYSGLPSAIRSYAESTVHAGLTGNGSFLIGASTIAVKVALTTVPAYLGEAAGDPVVLFDAGYITPIAAEAPLRGDRIRYNPQQFDLPAATEMLGYTLAGGVVATVTELVRGP